MATMLNIARHFARLTSSGLTYSTCSKSTNVNPTIRSQTLNKFNLNSHHCISSSPIRQLCTFGKDDNQTDGNLPRRAMIYVPGSDLRKLSKLSSLHVDCAVMDCEDGVAINQKDAARQNISQMLDTLHTPHIGDLAVRINSVASGLAEDDLNVTLSANRLPSTMVLPKVDSVGHIQWFGDKLSQALNGRELHTKIRLIIMVESALSLLHLPSMCEEGLWQSHNSPFALEGVVFGSDDFCADIGAHRTEDARELLYARQKIVCTVKAYGLQAIDLVHINYKDMESLEKQSLEGSYMGFTGKQVIHPNQIPVVQKAFSPSPEKIEWARELVKAFDEHQETGKGAMVFRGSMIDMPLVLQAKNILRLAEQT